MNAAWVCLAGILFFVLGYRFYARRLAGRVFKLRADEPVPAIEQQDGVDFVPTPKSILFGHHYASIAGAAPIIGPAIAIVWGWVPAFLWIVFGAVFMGAVHDFSTLVLSIRHGGRSVGQISGRLISPRTRTLYLLVVFCLVLVVIAVFAKAIATLFVKQPGTVLPINFQIVAAVAIGWFAYKRKARLLWPSLITLIALYAMVFVGVKVPLDLSVLVGSDFDAQQKAWVIGLMGYAFVASVLPVWVLLQPRDYINSHQLFVGLGALVLGLVIAQPIITAPAFATPPADAPALFPFLFVTVACGAISGFHGLVSSGTTSKQIRCAADARPIGYGSMLGEGLLALISTLAVSAGLANWSEHYHSWKVASATGVANFVEGASSFLVALGLPDQPAQVLIAVMVISFAATSLDTAVRIQRYILQELGEAFGFPVFRNRYVAGLVAVVLPLALYLGGEEGRLWPLFGATNQLLAGLSLTVVTVWIVSTGGNWRYVGLPAVFVLLISGGSLLANMARYLRSGDYLLLVVGAVILALQGWVVAEALRAIRRIRATNDGATSTP